jgi:micrococcal nuclease
MYEYKAVVKKVIDADTIDLVIDLGFYISVQKRVRVLGIDAPEVNTKEGKEAREFVRSYLQIGMDVIVRTEKDKNDKYGRFLADIIYQDIPLSKVLLDKGLAKPYAG